MFPIVSRVEWNDAFANVNVLDGVVDLLDAVAFIGDQRAFFEQEDLVGAIQQFKHHGMISNFCSTCQLTKRQTADAINDDMAFMTPEKFMLLLIVLIGCGVNAKLAIEIFFLMILRRKLVFPKDLGLFCAILAAIGVEFNCNERCIHDTQFVKLLHLFCH